MSLIALLFNNKSLHRARVVGAAKGLGVAFGDRRVQGYDGGYRSSDRDEHRKGDEYKTECTANPPLRSPLGRRAGSTRLPDPHGGGNSAVESVYEMYQTWKGRTPRAEYHRVH